MTSDAEIIRDINAAIGRRDLDRVSEGLHPEVVWAHNIGVGSPEEGVYRGRDDVMRLLERIVVTWEYIRLEQHEVTDLGEGSFLVKGELHAKHPTSATELVASYEQRLRLSGGLLVEASMTSGQEPVSEDSANVAAVRRWVDAFNRRDIDLVADELDPAAELHEWPAAPGARVYHGHDGVREAVDSWFEAWEWMEVEIEDLLEFGDRVLVTLHQRAKGKSSAAEVEIKSFNVYTFRDGKVFRMQLFTEREQALEAAGLTDSHVETR